MKRRKNATKDEREGDAATCSAAKKNLIRKRPKKKQDPKKERVGGRFGSLRCGGSAPEKVGIRGRGGSACQRGLTLEAKYVGGKGRVAESDRDRRTRRSRFFGAKQSALNYVISREVTCFYFAPGRCTYWAPIVSMERYLNDVIVLCNKQQKINELRKRQY